MIKIRKFNEEEDPAVVDLKQRLLRIDQDIADLKMRQSQTDDEDEKEDIKYQLDSLADEKESINNSIEGIKENFINKRSNIMRRMRKFDEAKKGKDEGEKNKENRIKAISLIENDWCRGVSAIHTNYRKGEVEGVSEAILKVSNKNYVRNFPISAIHKSYKGSTNKMKGKPAAFVIKVETDDYVMDVFLIPNKRNIDLITGDRLKREDYENAELVLSINVNNGRFLYKDQKTFNKIVRSGRRGK